MIPQAPAKKSKFSKACRAVLHEYKNFKIF